MNLDQLNKNQIVLLTLLVSFVTSIATGIVTVTLMDQTPTGATQTINQIVERTIERVVPSQDKPKTVPTPVIVTEENLIMKVIENGLPSVVRLIGQAENQTKPIGLGFIVRNTGVIVVPTALLTDANQPIALSFDNGTVLKAGLLMTDERKTLALLKLSDESLKKAAEAKIVLQPLKLSTGDSAVGQTIISLGSINDETNAVALGIVSSLNKPSGENATSAPITLRTNAASADNIGAPLMNVNGEVVGISTGAGVGLGVRTLRLLLESLQ